MNAMNASVKTGKDAEQKKPRKTRLEKQIEKDFCHNPTKYGQNPPQTAIEKIRLQDIRLEGFREGDKKTPVFKAIATEFDAARLSPPVVWKDADGIPHAFEGRKMIAAINERNRHAAEFMTHIWCEVVPAQHAESRKRAKALVERNMKKNHSLKEFRDRYAAKDIVAVDIVSKLSAKGVSIKGVGTQSGGIVKCLSPIEYAYRRGVLELMIDAVDGSWGVTSKGALLLLTLMPLAVVLGKNPHVIIKDLCRVLSGTTPRGLDAKAGSTDGRGRTVNIANHIVDMYNNNLPANQKIDKVGNSDL